MAGAATGGAENIFLEDVLALAEAGCAQYVVTRENNPHRLQVLHAHGVGVATASFSKWFPWPTTAVLRRAIERFQPDAVQYWMGRAGTFAEACGRPQIGWYGGYYKAARFAACDYHIGLTKDLIEHIVAQGIPVERTALIHTHASFPDVEPLPRGTLTTPEDAPLLLALARLHWKKGLDVLLIALAELPDAYLWIAGDGPLRHELEGKAEALGVSQRVRFLGWRDDRARLLKAADVCVFPSRYEPFGTVMVDAWAAGVPLVAAAAQGPKAYVKDGENGLLVPIDDIPSLVTAIRRAIDDQALRERIIVGGRQTYETTFTKAAFVRDSLAFYERVVGVTEAKLARDPA